MSLESLDGVTLGLVPKKACVNCSQNTLGFNILELIVHTYVEEICGKR